MLLTNSRKMPKILGIEKPYIWCSMVQDLRALRPAVRSLKSISRRTAPCRKRCDYRHQETMSFMMVQKSRISPRIKVGLPLQATRTITLQQVGIPTCMLRTWPAQDRALWASSLLPRTTSTSSAITTPWSTWWSLAPAQVVAKQDSSIDLSSKVISFDRQMKETPSPHSSKPWESSTLSFLKHTTKAPVPSWISPMTSTIQTRISNSWETSCSPRYSQMLTRGICRGFIKPKSKIKYCWSSRTIMLSIWIWPQWRRRMCANGIPSRRLSKGADMLQLITAWIELPLLNRIGMPLWALSRLQPSRVARMATKPFKNHRSLTNLHRRSTSPTRSECSPTLQTTQTTSPGILRVHLELSRAPPTSNSYQLWWTSKMLQASKS